ncbi:MAG: cytochrome C [Campylobacteraceae bacterium 4484_4]|nr:MAG: cytochrome C [Campylobacteraceae bacterium 4484_4]
MKKFLTLIATSLLVASIATTAASADPAKGQKLYLKKLKKACGFNGAKMAAKHTQEEWEEIKDSGKLEDEIKKLCPNVKDVKDKYLPDLFDFFYEYASDSGNVPSC